MKVIAHRVLYAAIAVFVTFGGVRSQDLSQQLSKLGATAAQNYVAPILGGFASDLNSALYYSADLHDILGFDVGVRLGAIKVTDADKTYLFVMPSQFTYQGYTLHGGTDYDQQVTANTAVGAKDGVPIKIKSNTITNLAGISGKTLFTTPGGFDLPTVPLPVPQVDIGLPFGFEVMGRFIPTYKAGDFGKVSFLGFGVRHSIDQYIPLCPVNIAVHFMTQKFNLKDSSGNNLISASATAFGAEVSKKLFILTLFGGFQIEKGSFTVGPYTQIDNSSGHNVNVQIPEFTVDGKNKSRFTVGARLLLLIFNVHAEYSFATQPTLGAGVGLTIR